MNKSLIFVLIVCVFSALYFEGQVGKCGKGVMAPNFLHGIEIEWFSSVNGLTPLIVDADRFTLVSEGGSVHTLHGKKLLIRKINRYAYPDDLYFEVQGEAKKIYYLLFSDDESDALKVNAFSAFKFETETGRSVKDLKWISLDPAKCFANYIDLLRIFFIVLIIIVSVITIYINRHLIYGDRQKYR